MKKIFRKALKSLGFTITRDKRPVFLADGKPSPYCKVPLQSSKVFDLKEIESIGDTVPGMISTQSGGHLYTLCLFQQEKGDVVEIGSWQGRSTVFLAYAAKASGNGQVWAIDHFKGNVGKEHFYVVNEKDLSDLKSGFEKNIDYAGLSEHVNLLDMPNAEAVSHIKDKSVRFLFIDGDHTREGVLTDLRLFIPKLIDDAIIVFDDFSKAFPGVVETVDEFLAEGKHSQVMSYPNTLVMRWKSN